jgi:hypothetical protein
MKNLINQSLRKDLTSIVEQSTKVNKKEFENSYSIDVTFPDNICPDSYLYDTEADRDADFNILDEAINKSKKD